MNSLTMRYGNTIKGAIIGSGVCLMLYLRWISVEHSILADGLAQGRDLEGALKVNKAICFILTCAYGLQLVLAIGIAYLASSRWTGKIKFALILVVSFSGLTFLQYITILILANLL